MSDSTWATVQVGPAREKASLKISGSSPGTVSPASFSHSGRATIASRGSETPYTVFRSAEMCTRIVVSERWPMSVWPSMSLPAPARVSEPITRMLSGSPPLSGFFLTRCSISRPALMFPSSFL